MKKINGFICVFVLLCQITFAQNQATLDSLQNVLEGELSAIEKVDTYNLIANQYGESDSSLVLQYTGKAIALAEANNYLEGIADAYYHIAWMTMMNGSYFKAKELFGTMLETAQKANYKKGEGKVYQGLGIISSELGDFDEALEYHEKSFAIKNEINDQKGMASSYNSIAIIYAMKGKLEQSLEYFTKMLETSKALNNQFGIARSYNNIGIIHEEMGNYPKALEFYQKSLKIKEELGDKSGLASAYNNIGMIHLAQENFSAALENYQKSLGVDTTTGNKKGIAEDLANLGTISQKLGDFEDAFKYFQDGLKIHEEIGNKSGLATINLYLGKLDIELNKYKDAQKNLENSLRIYQEIGQKNTIPEVLVYLGISFYHQKNYQQAQQKLLEGINLALEAGTAEPIKAGSEILAKTYEALGNYKRAYEYHITFKEMTDSLFNKENTRKIAQLSTQYTYEKEADSLRIVQEQEKALLSKEKKLLSIEVKQQRTTQLATFLVLGLTFIIVIVLIFFYRSKQKSNLQLNAVNTELKSFNEELTSANEKINQASEEIKTINDSLNATLETVEKQRDDILSSINYAQRIQNAVLPSPSKLQKSLSDYFIFYKPRNVVSGDFYWFEEVGNKQFMVVADCTGHGVPGAFMTLLGTQALSDIIIQKEIHKPNEILQNLDNKLFKLLRNENTQLVDGMDMVVCVYDKLTKTLEFAGAKNPILLIQNKELKEIKGDIHSINGHRRKDQFIAFKNHSIELNIPATLYLYSDGFQDQFGGKENKKFMKKHWKNLLLETSELPISEQEKHLESVLQRWMDDYPQVDDILVMGIQISIV